MEGNGDNSPAEQDHGKAKADLDTPEAKAARLLNRRINSILSIAKELQGKGESHGDDFDSRDVKYGLSVFSNGAYLQVRTPDGKVIDYSILSNRNGESDDHPGFDRITIVGRHTDVDTLPVAQEYMREHPGDLEHRDFSTTYYVNNKSVLEWKRISEIPEPLADKEEMSQYSRDFRGHMTRISHMGSGDIEQAGSVAERIEEELKLLLAEE